jgi:acyl homoserine lactone synthase
MQLIVVDHKQGAKHQELVAGMLRLRARVFADRLNWQVNNEDGLERDHFDDQEPTYILGVENDVRVVGCVRLSSPMRSSMLNEVFPDLLEGRYFAMHDRMIESSRFCIDKDVPEQEALASEPGLRGYERGLRKESRRTSIVQLRTRLLLAGIVEWCLACGYDELVTATDLKFERLLNMVGWPLRRLGPPKMINETHSVAGSLAISPEVLQRLKPWGYHSLLDQTARAG